MSNATPALTPFELLQQIGRTSQDAAGTTGLATIRDDQAVGVGFSIAGYRLVADMKNIGEVLSPPPVMPIPNVKPWVLGVANIRGRLIPIIDMLMFSGEQQDAPQMRNRRVVTAEIGDSYVGLVVEHVFGMRYFFEDGLTTPQSDEIAEWLNPHINGCFVESDQKWFRFDVESLFFNPKFMDVAA